MLCLAMPACRPTDVAPRLDDEDAGRFAGLADLVLFARPARDGGSFLLARFETTRADWLAWLSAADREILDLQTFDRFNPGGETVLPAVGMTLAEARDHAAWRFGRLPRIDEWRFAATVGGRYRLPWGDTDRAAWSNTAELRIGAVVPVGAFEAGRQRDGCYDLVGNAAEWTTTPAAGVIRRRPTYDPIRGGTRARAARLDRHPALRPWRGVLLAWPATWLVAADDGTAPRLCAPGFDEPLLGLWNADPGTASADDRGLRSMRPGERSSRVGMRVATDGPTLLRHLTRLAGKLRPAEERALRRFLRRDELRALLTDAARDAVGRQDDRPVLRILREELGL